MGFSTGGFTYVSDPGQISFGVWEEVEELVLTADATNTDFTTTLAGNTDKSYRIELQLVKGGAGTPMYGLRVNGAAAVGNRTSCLWTGAAASVNEAADVYFTDAANTGTLFEAMVHIPVAETGQDRRIFASVAVRNAANQCGVSTILQITTPNSSTEITSLGISSHAADGIGSGSILRLWRRA